VQWDYFCPEAGQALPKAKPKEMIAYYVEFQNTSYSSNIYAPNSSAKSLA